MKRLIAPAIAAALAAATPLAHAWPDKAVTIVVPTAIPAAVSRALPIRLTLAARLRLPAVSGSAPTLTAR